MLLTLMAQNTERMRLGTCVTNPATREPSVTASTLAVLQLLTKGRMDLGIGRGDSARRVLGKPPTTLASLEEATQVIRDLCEGREVTYEGTKLRLDWAEKYRLPVWIAGYGPEGARAHRPRRGRRDHPARGPQPRRLVRRPSPEGRARRRSRSELGGGHGRGAGAPRRSQARARRGPLVPRPGEQSRRRSGQALRGAGPSVGPHGLRPRSTRLRLPAPRRVGIVERGVRRRRIGGAFLRDRRYKGAHREAAEAGRGRCRSSSTSTS